MTTARTTQRLFRENRAGHLAGRSFPASPVRDTDCRTALCRRIELLARENMTLRDMADIEQVEREPLGYGPTGFDKKDQMIADENDPDIILVPRRPLVEQSYARHQQEMYYDAHRPSTSSGSSPTVSTPASALSMPMLPAVHIRDAPHQQSPPEFAQAPPVASYPPAPRYPPIHQQHAASYHTHHHQHQHQHQQPSNAKYFAPNPSAPMLEDVDLNYFLNSQHQSLARSQLPPPTYAFAPQ